MGHPPRRKTRKAEVERYAERTQKIYLADDGPGVAEADLPHVFERFYKGADGKHGIGLAIAKAVAETWHGTLQVRNDGGAVFEAVFELDAK